MATCPPTCINGLAYTVDSTGDGRNVGPVTQCNDGTSHCTLRAAIEAANAHAGDDGIFFNIPTAGNNCDASGNCTINLGAALPDLSDNVSITGPGPDSSKLTVRRNSATQFRIFNVTATGAVSFSLITIANGNSAELGGAIRVSATLSTGLTVTNCTFSSNQASSGGGAIANVQSANVSISNCVFSQNLAGNPSGNNFGDEPGGAILNQASGTVGITGCTISSNGALGTKGGGGVANTGAGTINVTNCTLDHNLAGGIPGGATGFNQSPGGGISNNGGGTVTLSGSALTGNNATGRGGGAANLSGKFTATNSTFSANSVTVSSGNTSDGSGGGIYHASGVMTLTNCNITGNSVSGLFSTSIAGSAYGGGIFHADSLTISGSTVSGNTALGASPENGSGGAAFGGGMYSSGALIAFNCTIAANSALGGMGFGGGAGGQASGGGICVASSSNVSVTIDSTTIALNSAAGGGGSPTAAGLGGGMFEAGSIVNVKSCLIANNTAQSPDVDGSYASQGFNLIGKTNGSAGFASGTDLVGTSSSPLDPKLDSNGLQNNGGPTQTIALLTGSPAIDKGTSAGPNGTLPTDQRGLSRTVDDPNIPNAGNEDGTDIGAYELQTVGPTPTPTATPTATPGRLGNVSTRLQVGTGNNVLFAGFIIQGSASKTVLIRSAGPSLTSFGVPGALANPQLELHDANNLIGTNDNWQTTQIGGVITSNQVAAIQNSGAAPADPAEPAIIATLPAGTYTAIVQGVGGTQGVATVEVYDLSPNNGATLVNISTRGFIQTGDNVMIGGFIIVGQPARVIVLATGPSLIPLGINNALTNPRLELHDANGTLAMNDDWQTTQLGGIITSDQSAAIQNSGLAPSNPAESAIIATLAPGTYTAIAQGVNGGTGVGVVQVFALP